MSELKYGEWVSVKERLPEFGQPVLASRLHDGKMEVARRPINTSTSTVPFELYFTHWMPLPPPPPKPDPFEEWFDRRVSVPGGWMFLGAKEVMREAWNAALEHAKKEGK